VIVSCPGDAITFPSASSRKKEYKKNERGSQVLPAIEGGLQAREIADV
jgi:hypothetical protein